MSWYGLIKNGIVRPFVVLAYGAKIQGAENIPATGGVVLAVNHTSMVETYTLPCLIKRQLTYPAKAELFKGNRGFISKVIAWAMKAVKQVPLDRSGGAASLNGLGPVLDVLKDGGLVGIYPEGTRSIDGRLYKGKTGVARLALGAGVPVIPVAVLNAQVTGTLFGLIPMAKKPLVVVGKPLHFEQYHGCENDRDVLRWVTDEIMYGIQQLSGQEYVDSYCTSVRSNHLTPEEIAAKVCERPGGGTPPAPCAPVA